MGLGPRIDLRVSQQLVMTQQLQQAIKLLALSNLEIEAVIAEELAKNPLLEARPGEGAAGESVVVRQDQEYGDEAADPSGSDELIARLGGAVDSPVDMDWREAALEVDSFADVGGSPVGEEAFDFDRLEGGGTGLAEHLLGQLHGTGGTRGRLAEARLLNLDEPVSATLAEWALDERKASIPLRSLLNGTSGLAFTRRGERTLNAALAMEPREVMGQSYSDDETAYLLFTEIARRKLVAANAENDPARWLTTRTLLPSSPLEMRSAIFTAAFRALRMERMISTPASAAMPRPITMAPMMNALTRLNEASACVRIS